MSRSFKPAGIAAMILAGMLALSACGGDANLKVLTPSQQDHIMAQAGPPHGDSYNNSQVAALKSDGYTAIALNVDDSFFTGNTVRSILFKKCQLDRATLQECSKQPPSIDQPSIYMEALSSDSMDASSSPGAGENTDKSDPEALYDADSVLGYVATVKAGKKQVTMTCFSDNFQLNPDSIKKIPRVFHAFTDHGIKTGDMLVDFSGKALKKGVLPRQGKIRWTCHTK